MPTVMADHPRVAVVTGGSGIGRATAQRLARAAWPSRLRTPAGRRPQRKSLPRSSRPEAWRFPFRATSPRSPTSQLSSTRAELSYGGVHVVVNTAGIMLLSPLVDLDLEVFDRMVRINLRGTFVVGREATRRVRPGGAIINFSSSVQKIARPSYSATRQQGGRRRDHDDPGQGDAWS